MFTGYLELGGGEIANRLRAWTYATQNDCTSGLILEPKCEPDADAIGEAEAYSYDRIRRAPWYDQDYPETSAGFLGFYATGVSGIDDSTWSAEITEGILDGGTISMGRYGARQIRVTGLLVATHEVSLEHGMSWLMGALAPNSCSSHGAACGEQDLAFFAGCPRPRADFSSDSEYRAHIDRLVRLIHGVKLISGPISLSQRRVRDNAYLHEIEFTLGASSPHIYTRTTDPGLITSESAFLLDSPYNLIPTPSAELPTSTKVVLSRNLVTNPSFEVNISGWAAGLVSSSGSTPPTIATARSTAISAHGAASMLSRIQPTSGSGRMSFMAEQSTGADVSSIPTGGSISITAWAALISAATPATLHSLSLSVVFRDSGGTQIDKMTFPGANLDGNVWSANIKKPANATRAYVAITADVSWVSGSDVRLYVDAVALTTP